MGLQTTTGKRKLEAAAAPSDHSTPAKSGRWEADDCIARLRAVAVPGESSWRPPTPATFFAAATTTTTTAAADDFVDDDDDFDDELSSDDDRFPTTLTPTPPTTTTTPSSYQLDYVNRWQWYEAPQQHTIREDENGKSYLDLGTSPSPPPSPLPQPPPSPQSLSARQRWCDMRMKCGHLPCYRQRRMTVLNMSMCKLAR